MSETTDELKRVLTAICTLGEEFGGPPKQSEIADHLGVTQQYVSKMMFGLVVVGAIEWRTRTAYKVIDARWEPPPNSPV